MKIQIQRNDKWMTEIEENHLLDWAEQGQEKLYQTVEVRCLVKKLASYRWNMSMIRTSRQYKRETSYELLSNLTKKNKEDRNEYHVIHQLIETYWDHRLYEVDQRYV